MISEIANEKKKRKNTSGTIDEGNITLALLCRKLVTFEKETKTEKNLPYKSFTIS